MKRWKRKLGSCFIYLATVFVAAQVLLLLPGPTIVIQTGMQLVHERHVFRTFIPADKAADPLPLVMTPRAPDSLGFPALDTPSKQDRTPSKKTGASSAREKPRLPAQSITSPERNLIEKQTFGNFPYAKNPAEVATTWSEEGNRDRTRLASGSIFPQKLQKNGAGRPSKVHDFSGSDVVSESAAKEQQKTAVVGKTMEPPETKHDVNVVREPTTELQAFSYRPQSEFKPWIILDGLRRPCSDVSVYTADGADWRIIVVNNGNSTVHGCKSTVCQVQEKTDLNQAYLTAVSHGARVILLADCVSRYPQLEEDFRILDAYQYGLFYNASNIFNPFQHAGFDAVFPRPSALWDRPISDPPGEGVSLSPPESNSEMYSISDFGRVSFRQGFRFGEDVCVCEDPSSFIPEEYEGLDSPVVAGQNTLVQFGTGPSLMLPDAFYWLFVPRGLSGSLLETFRTFWLHALKRAGLIHTGLFYLNARGNTLDEGSRPENLKPCADMKNPSTSINLSAGGGGRYRFSATARSAFQCVQQTSCESSTVEVKCASHLSLEVFRCLGLVGEEQGYLEEHVKALSAWFTQLRKHGVPGPQPRPLRVVKQSKNTFQVKYSLNQQHLYRNTNNNNRDNTTRKSQKLKEVERAVVQPIANKCPNLTRTGFRFPESWGPKFTKNGDVALVVTINYEFLFKTIAHVEFVHRQSFKYILYCGPNMTEFKRFLKEHGGLDHVTYIDGAWSGSTGWHTIYNCLTLAMKMRLPVKGYLQVGEDVLINSASVASQPRDKVWILKFVSRRNVTVAEDKMKWYHWDKPWGRPALLNLFRLLQSWANFTPARPSSSSPKAKSLFGEEAGGPYGLFNGTFQSPIPGRTPKELQRAAKRFLETYSANVGSVDIVVNRATDFVYIPESWRDDYVILAEMFQHAGVILEFAFPMLHLGLTPKKDANYIRGASLWRGDRNTPWKFYRKDLIFLHPFKSMANLKNPEGLAFFCDTYLTSYEEWVHSS